MSKHIQSFIIQYVVSYFSCYFSNPKANPSNTPASSHIVHQKTHTPVTLQTIPDRVLQASTSTTAEGSMELLENWNQRQVRPLKFIYFSSATLEMASWESANISWDLRALTESILVVLLLSLRIQWFFEHQQSKTKKGRVSVNFP